MSKSATQTKAKAEDAAKGTPFSFNTITAPGMTPFTSAPQFGDAMKLGTQVMQAWYSTGQVMSRFYSERMRKDVANMQAYAACRTPAEFATLTRRVMSEVAHDYADHVDHVIAISMNADDASAKK